MTYELVSMKSKAFSSPRTEVSHAAFRILTAADGHLDLASLARRAGLSDGDMVTVFPEILRLWQERFIRMQSGAGTARTLAQAV